VRWERSQNSHRVQGCKYIEAARPEPSAFAAPGHLSTRHARTPQHPPRPNTSAPATPEHLSTRHARTPQHPPRPNTSAPATPEHLSTRHARTPQHPPRPGICVSRRYRAASFVLALPSVPAVSHQPAIAHPRRRVANGHVLRPRQQLYRNQHDTTPEAPHPAPTTALRTVTRFAHASSSIGTSTTPPQRHRTQHPPPRLEPSRASPTPAAPKEPARHHRWGCRVQRPPLASRAATGRPGRARGQADRRGPPPWRPTGPRRAKPARAAPNRPRAAPNRPSAAPNDPAPRRGAVERVVVSAVERQHQAAQRTRH